MRARKQRIRKITVSCLVLLLLSGFSSVARAGSSENAEDRDVLIDQALGGMKEGSRILSPEGYAEKTAIPEAPGSKLAPTIDTQALSSSQGPEKAAIIGSGVEGISSNAGSISSPVGVGASAGMAGEVSAGSGSVVGVGAGIGDIGAGSGSVGGGLEGGSGGAGPSAGSGATLIDVDANINLDSGTVDAGLGIDTNAGIQESTILDADLSAAGGGTAVESSETVLSPESDLVTEVDTSGSSVAGETDVGIEAGVTGTSAGDDVVSDPADGIPAGL